MKATTFFLAACSAALVACGDAMGPEDTVDMVGTWEVNATPRGNYECRVNNLTLILTPPPADTVAPPGWFFGTTSGGEAGCLDWGPNPLQPGVVRGHAFFNDEDGAWLLDLSVRIEQQQFRLSTMAEFDSANRIKDTASMGVGGVYHEFCDITGDCQGRTYSFVVNVTIERR